jgi:hypothetical protein
MMSDDPAPGEGPIVDEKVVNWERHKCLVMGLLVVGALAIAAIVLPLTLDNCDCPSSVQREPLLAPTISPVPAPSPDVVTTPAPVAAPTSPVAPTPAPVVSPTPAPQTEAPTTQGFGIFLKNFIVPISGEEVFLNEESPQYKAAVFLAMDDAYGRTLDTLDELRDRYAMSVFYYAMNGDGWNACFQGDTACSSDGLAWMDPDVDHCLWDAVSCNSAGRVTDIVFGKKGIDVSLELV